MTDGRRGGFSARSSEAWIRYVFQTPRILFSRRRAKKMFFFFRLAPDLFLFFRLALDVELRCFSKFGESSDVSYDFFFFFPVCFPVGSVLEERQVSYVECVALGNFVVFPPSKRAKFNDCV